MPSGPAIQPTYDSAKHGLEDKVGSKLGRILTFGPSDGVDDIANTSAVRNGVVEIAQGLAGVGVVADLEELNAELVRRSIEAVELAGGVDNDALRVVLGLAVSQDNDIEGLDVVKVVSVGFEDGQVGIKDGLEASAGQSAAAGADGAEEALDVGGGGDALIAGGAFAARGSAVGAVIEEVNIYAVVVMRRANGRNLRQARINLAPSATGHGTRVINDEGGVECG